MLLSLNKHRRVYEPQDHLSFLHVFSSYSLSAPQFHCACAPCPSLPYSAWRMQLLFTLDLTYHFYLYGRASIFVLFGQSILACRNILKQLSPGVTWRFAGACNFERIPVKMVNEYLLQERLLLSSNKGKICSEAEDHCNVNETSNYSLKN